MKNTIYYFSGRGNSLKTAQEIAKRLGSAALLPIKTGTGTSVPPVTETIGIFTPVIDLGIPSYVLKFIDNLKVTDKDVYIYAVVTCGGLPGAAVEQLRKRLAKKSLKLSADFVLTFGIDWSADDAWLKRIDRISGIIQSRQVEKSDLTWKDRLLTAANPLAKMLIPAEDKKFTVEASCTGCGTCRKICPVSNIRMKEGRPEWQHSCEQCAACFSWCPAAAITGTNLAARTHFTNPHITLNQMLSRPEA